MLLTNTFLEFDPNDSKRSNNNNPSRGKAKKT